MNLSALPRRAAGASAISASRGKRRRSFRLDKGNRFRGKKRLRTTWTRYAGATGEGTTVIKNMSYFAATRNDVFTILPVEHIAYRRGPKPAPFEFKGTSGWTITIDRNSKDVTATK